MIEDGNRTSEPRDVKTDTKKLQVLQACETWSSRILGGWLPGVSIWEAKHRVGLALWEDMQTARDLRTRLWELRVSKPDRMPESELLARLMERTVSCQNEFELVAGLFLGLKRKMAECCRAYLEKAHPVWDAPTLPLLEKALAKLESQCAWAEDFLKEHDQVELTRSWLEYLGKVIDASGVFGGKADSFPAAPPTYQCLLPFPEAKRDERFETSLSGFDRPDIEDHDAHVKWQFANYAMEMQA